MIQGFTATIQFNKPPIRRFRYLIKQTIVENQSLSSILANLVDRFEPSDLTCPSPEIGPLLEIIYFRPQGRIDLLEHVLYVRRSYQKTADQSP